jgi:hypothetical protein
MCTAGADCSQSSDIAVWRFSCWSETSLLRNFYARRPTKNLSAIYGILRNYMARQLVIVMTAPSLSLI